MSWFQRKAELPDARDTHDGPSDNTQRRVMMANDISLSAGRGGCVGESAGNQSPRGEVCFPFAVFVDSSSHFTCVQMLRVLLVKQSGGIWFDAYKVLNLSFV